MSVLMNRIRSSMSNATGTQQFTPDQEFFIRTNAFGRWQSDFDTGAHAPVHIHCRHADGTVDTIAATTHMDNYLLMQGKGGRDIAVGRI